MTDKMEPVAWMIRFADGAVKAVPSDFPGAFPVFDHPPAGSMPNAIPLNDDTRDILGRMCFQCIGLAQMLRRCGHDIPRGAEHEQASVLHWTLNLYLKHGDKWREAAKKLVAAAHQPEGQRNG